MSLQKFLLRYGSSSHKRIIFYVLCLSVSSFLQFLGFILPGWGYLKGDVLTIHVGLWYRVTCKKAGGCQTMSMVTGQPNKDDDMLEYQIETFLALAACVVAITTLVIHVRYVKNKVNIALIIGMLASLLSGVLALLASCKMGYKYQQRHNEQMNGYGKSVYKSPYSLFLTGTGGIITCIVTFGLLLENHILFKNISKKYSVINNQLFRQEQQMVDSVNTGVPRSSSLRQSNEVPTQNSTTYTNVAVARVANIPTVQGMNDNTYLYAWPSTKSRQSSKHVSETSTAAGAVDTSTDPEYRNVVLDNGQRVIMNDIYDI